MIRKKTKPTFKILIIIFFSVLITSCLKRGEHIKYEKGVIIEKQYQPEFNAEGISFNSNSDVGYHTLQESEKFILVFKCAHGTVFSKNSKSLYYELNKNDSVIIEYYDMIDRYGGVQDYEFVSASKY